MHLNNSILLFSTILLSTCSSIPDNIASNFRLAFDSIEAAIFGFEDYPISRDLVNNIPYASIRVKIGKGPAGLLILESKTENLNTWVSADGVSITEKKGQIVRTTGLINNLTAFRSLQNKTFLKFLASGPINIPTHYEFLSLDNPEVFELRLDSQIFFEGNETVGILDKEFYLAHFSKQKENKFLRWKVKDHFWIDSKDGFVWKSIQNIAPNLPPIMIEVTKKPAD